MECVVRGPEGQIEDVTAYKESAQTNSDKQEQQYNLKNSLFHGGILPLGIETYLYHD